MKNPNSTVSHITSYTSYLNSNSRKVNVISSGYLHRSRTKSRPIAERDSNSSNTCNGFNMSHFQQRFGLNDSNENNANNISNTRSKTVSRKISIHIDVDSVKDNSISANNKPKVLCDKILSNPRIKSIQSRSSKPYLSYKGAVSLPLFGSLHEKMYPNKTSKK